MKTRSTSRSRKPQTSPKISKTTARRYRLAVACLLLLLLLVYFGSLFWQTSSCIQRTTASQPAPAATGIVLATQADENIADANAVAPSTTASLLQSCQECHAEISAHYDRSGMSHTWQSAFEGCAGDFSQTTRVIDRRTNYEYRVRRAGMNITQTEQRSDVPEHTLERRAAYVVGSGKHAQAMVANENGYLTQMPVAWYAGRGQWDLNPGFELKNHRFDRAIVPGCVACHSSGASHDSPSKNRFHDAAIFGIGCNRCHGDVAVHVNYWKEKKSSAGGFEGDVINPATFTSSQANDLCLQCHLQGDVVLFRSDKDPLTYQPGQRLRDQRQDFLIATEDNSRLGVASHGARMLQSKCYSGSSGTLTCVLCHDPHRPASDTSRQVYDQRCNTCHDSDDCSRKPQVDALASLTTESCTGCHMPQRSSREGIHLVFTDHAIVRQADTHREKLPPVLAPNSDAKLVNCWPDEDVAKSSLAAAYQLLNETMGPQRPSSEKAIKLLTDVVAETPSDTDSHFWLGSALLSTGRGLEAVGHFQKVLTKEPKRSLARYRLALAQEQAGKIDDARMNYEQLIVEHPSWLEPYPRLVQIYLSRQQHQSAIRILQQQLSHCADAHAYATLGLAYGLAGGDQRHALGWVDQSIKLDPLSAQSHLYRAVLLLMENRNALAESALRRALAIDPQNPQARQALEQLKK